MKRATGEAIFLQINTDRVFVTKTRSVYFHRHYFGRGTNFVLGDFVIVM